MLRLLALFLSLTFSITAISPAPTRLDDAESKAFHHITQETIVEADSCSATAIGPHALLTASHCELATDKISVDGTEYVITQIIRDGEDHTIYIIPAAHFTKYLDLANRLPVTGERVRGWGWPGDVPDPVYKEGRFVRVIRLESGAEGWAFNYPVFAGDSGGAVIDDSGKILTVVSLGDEAAHMIGFPLDFSPDQLARARA